MRCQRLRSCSLNNCIRIQASILLTFIAFLLIFPDTKENFQKNRSNSLSDNELEPDSTWNIPIFSIMSSFEDGYGSVKRSILEHDNDEVHDKVENDKKDKNKPKKQKQLLHVHVSDHIKQKVEKHKKKKKLNQAPTHNDRTKVLIFARWRAGSSFVGELFNSDENAFYIYEPLYTRGYIDQETSYQDILNINAVPVIQTILDKYYNNCTVPRDSIRRFNKFNTAIANLDHANFSNYSESRIKYEVEKACYKIDEVCSSYEIRVSKTIRLKSLNHLPDSLKQNSNVTSEEKNNLKIIFLTRDPRGLAATRFKHSKSWSWSKTSQKLNNICETYDRFIRERAFPDKPPKGTSKIKFQPDDKKTWNNEVLVIRYEDMAHEPLKMAEKIYKFIGKELPETMKEKLLDEDFIHKAGLSSKGWSKGLDFEAVKQIQEHCSTMDPNGLKIGIRASRSGHIDLGISIRASGHLDPGIWASRSGHLDPGIWACRSGHLGISIWASGYLDLGISIRASGHLDPGIWASRSGHLGISIRASGYLDLGIWASRSGHLGISIWASRPGLR